MNKTILAIGAHPDDVELGVGGTIYKHWVEGDHVNVLIVSRGESGVPNAAIDNNYAALSKEDMFKKKGAIREEETIKSLVTLGVPQPNINILGYPNNSVQCTQEMIDDIQNTVMRLVPDIVYTHYFMEQHIDHINTSIATLHSTRRIKNVLLYESPSTGPSFSPVYFVNISECIEKKIEALRKHASQASKEYMSDDVIRSQARFRGYQSKLGKYAEAFIVYRMSA